jgi:prevent-host-death family protein
VKTASITETKNQLSALIDQVRHGETIVIMDRGRPVARLEPVAAPEVDDPDGRIARLERQGLLRRPLEALNGALRQPGPQGPPDAGLVEAVIEERNRAR